MTKKNDYSKAEAAFAEQESMHIASEGRPFLGAQIGTEEYIVSYEWVEE